MRRLRGLGAPLAKFVIFAIVTVLCTGVLAATIANTIGGNTVTYRARFSDAASVVDGDDVRIAGVRVGEVTGVSLVDRKVALVTFVLQNSVRLPKTVEATVKYRNLIGERYISLDQPPGSPADFLPAGATIPLTQTHPALNLTQLFNGFQPLFQALSPNEVNKLSFELVQVLQGEGGTVSSLLGHTASLTNTIADKDQVIGQVIDNLNAVLDTVNARAPELTQLIVTVRQLVSGFAQDRNTIGEAISSIGELTDSTADLLRDARPPLRDDIRDLGDVARNLNDRRDLVEHFLTFLPHKLDALIPLGTYASWFNFYFCDLSGTVTLPAPLSTKLTIPAVRNPQSRCMADQSSSTSRVTASQLPQAPSLPALPAGVPGLGGKH